MYQKDIVYTPDYLARLIVDYFKPTGKCLDPCMGDGAFYQYLPEGAEWCEIAKGRDFFDWEQPVDWCIGNPPYSICGRWIRHSMKVADNIAYLVPVNKFTNSYAMMLETVAYGGIPQILVLGVGRKLGFPFGYACGVIHFKRGYKGDTKIEIYDWAKAS